MNILKRIFVKPVTIIFAIIVAIVLGVVSTSSMAVNLLPDISFPFLCVQVIYTGADAETIDKKVTAPLENVLQTVSDIHEISTYSLDNASVIVLRFEYGTNTNKKQDEMEEKIKTVNLPDGCNEPTISKIDLNTTSIFSLTIYSEEGKMDDTLASANEIKSKLSSINGVGSVKLSGAPNNYIKVDTINGLEMFSGILVQELAQDSALDIPLGEISSSNGSISVNNHSSAETIDAINNLTIGLELPQSYISAFKSVQETIKNIEKMNVEDTLNMKSDADDMNKFIDTLNSDTDDELDKLVDNLSSIKGMVNLIENNSSTTLKMMWSTTLKGLFENEDFKNLSEDELHDLANDINISYGVLKWLQDNAEIDPTTIDPITNPKGSTYAEGKWNKIVKFKKDKEDAKQDIVDSDYPGLFYEIELIPNDPSEEGYMDEEEIVDAIKLGRVINTYSLNEVVDKLKNDEEVTNSDYASLFIGSGYEYNIPINAYTIKMIRDSHFEQNYQVFYNYKIQHVHDEEEKDDDENIKIIQVGNNISSVDFIEMYNQMAFDEEFEIRPTVRILDFIRDVDFTSSQVKIKIHQMADVYLVNDEYDSMAYYNSKQAIQIDIYGDSGSNASAIAKEAKKIIKEYNLDANNKCKIVSLNNQADFINDSLSNALVSLLIGSLLAVLVIYLFLRKVKSSLIIALSMPLSVLLTLCVLYLMGITLNMVSIGGIAVGIGMLVDNSIVVLESITAEKEKGKDVLKASVDGVKLVIGSLIGSTLTSICVFFPILLIDGLTKEIFSDLSWAVIFSLSFSLLVAVIVIPTLFCLFFRKNRNNDNKPSVGKTFKKLDAWYINLLSKILKHKGVSILAAMGIFIASIGLVFTCPIEFLPSIDQHKIEVTISYDAGKDSTYCQNKTMQAYQILIDNLEDVSYMSQSVGFTGLIETTRTGSITIQLEDNAKRTSKVVEDIREIFEKNSFEEKYSVVEQDGVVASLTGGMSGVSVTIYGDDVDTLKEIATKIEDDVKTKKGVKNTKDNMLTSSTSYDIVFDKDALVEKGVSYQTLVQTLRIGLAGYDVYQIEDQDNTLDVKVSWIKDTIGDYYQSIEKFIVGIDNEMNFIHLEDVASINVESGRHIIRKVNGLNQLDISIESYGIDTNTASKYLNSSTSKVLKEYKGYTYASGGVSYYLTDAFQGLIIALVISFFLLFGVMACLFESLRKPIIIIFSFPFAFAGGFLALAISRVSLNVVSFIGLIMLMGVIINDAIVLNERFDQLVEEGMEKQKAVLEGCRQRLRAVLMTTLTTVLALIPMALGLGKGGALMQPLGVVAIGGMTIGTLVTLIIIPCAYSLMYRISFKNLKKEAKINEDSSK